MKYSLFLHLTAGVLILAGCSSTPTKVDTGPIKATTFNFVNSGSVAPADFADNDAEVHAQVQKSIAQNLSHRGVSRAEGLGDITVAYLIIVSDNASTTAISQYFGYGRDVSGLAEKAHEKSAVESDNPNYFVAGTLLIDILDSRTYKLLKRNYVVRPVLGNITADARAVRIQEAVDAALSSLKIAQ